MKGLAGWIVFRTILIADLVLVVVAGFMSLLWVQRPGGVIIAGGMWLGVRRPAARTPAFYGSLPRGGPALPTRSPSGHPS